MISILLVALWIGPAQSGSWFTPERNGEGFTLQVLEDGTAHAIWFTYPPTGSEAQQAWIYASGGRIEGDRIRFEGAITTRGPRFGAAYDPAQLQLLPWGSLDLRFTSCNEGEVTFAGPSAWGSGTRRLTRLTALAELECTGKRRLNAGGARTLEGLRNRSGAWFDPAHNGEGWTVEELPDGRAQVYWFTYDERGEQAWTIGVAPASGTSMVVADNLRPTGTRFGAAFDGSQVRNNSWGRLELQLTSCSQGSVSYQSTLGVFGSGTLRPVKLTQVAAAPCIEGSPAIPTTGTWSTGAAEPRPASEPGVASADGVAYLAGGFSEGRSFKSYSADRNQWTLLADLPAGRDHAVATIVNGELLVTGGNHNGGGDHSSNGWRYIAAENRWEAVSQLPFASQSGGASLGGFAYFGTVDGSLWQYDPRTRASRVIRGDARAPRDHSQLVAFQGELWLIGGRELGSRETGRVSIYDPASELWRPGPILTTARAGQAVAASPTLIMVAGGELLARLPWLVTPSVEVIGAGQDAWSSMPSMPHPLHGFGGMIRGNAFFTLGGSDVAGGVGNPGLVQVLRW